MRLGIISDIHGNLNALEAVLKELENKNIDKIICLGDLIGGAPKSEEVVQKMIQIKDRLIVVRGNREKYIIEGMPIVVHDEKMKISKEQLEYQEWLKNQLTDSSKDYIYSLPKEIIYEVEDKKIYISHYPMNEDGSFRKHIKKANVEENKEMFCGIDADIYLYGHTHVEIYNKQNNKLYINPGALGCPEKTNYATYGILNITKEDIEYEQLKVEYNVQHVIQEIEKVKFPNYKKVLTLFYGITN